MTAYFDTAAITWDTKQQRVAQAKAIAKIIEQTIPLTQDIKALEFGCGTGLLGFDRAEIEQCLLDEGLSLITSQTGFINKKIINEQKVAFPVFVIIAQKNVNDYL